MAPWASGESASARDSSGPGVLEEEEEEIEVESGDATIEAGVKVAMMLFTRRRRSSSAGAAAMEATMWPLSLSPCAEE